MFAFLTSGILFGQVNPNDFNLTPNGVLDNVFDNYGTQYKLQDLLIDTSVNANPTSRVALLTCNSTSYFNLYFEQGSGMETVTDPTQNAINTSRRNVICKVFQDISNFIQSPLTGTTNKVNIWVRNINSVIVTPNSPNGVLGLATGFYVLPNVNNAAIGGIADNEIWKTIHLGVDSYANVASPLTPNDPNTVSAGSYFHGMVAFNFNTTNIPAIAWNTSLTAGATGTQYDLYSVALHEITHALGFASLIDQNGNSKFGANFKYYSRYDKFLKNSDIVNPMPLLTSSSACSSLDSMYNFGFNPNLLPTILRSGCTLSGNTFNGSSDNTACGTALRFSGTSNVPIYTPTCFEAPSSFSHFEDTCYTNSVTNAVYGNNNYFVMCNASSQGAAGTRRFLKPEERNVLCDLGYKVNTTFGNSSNTSLNAPVNYYGNSACSGIDVAGLNDGINNGQYAWIVDQGNNIAISGATLLVNDRNATGFECLHDMTTNIDLLATGNGTSLINFSSNVSGVHLLRYVPTVTINGTTQRGNVTFLYVFVKSTAVCGSVAQICDNLVVNGGFENYTSLPLNLPSAASPIKLSCGWESANSKTPDYYNSSSPNSNYQIPCNVLGSQSCNNGFGNSYAGIWRVNNGTFNSSENIYTKLSNPLQANTKYLLTFDVSLAEGCSIFAEKLQAYLSVNDIGTPLNDLNIPTSNLNMLQTSTDFKRSVNEWETISLNFKTTSGGEEFLYIGNLIQPILMTSNTPNPSLITPTCNAYVSYNFLSNSAYYYLDNVRLIPIYGSFVLPTPITCTQNPLVLMDYVQGLPTNGTFTLTGQPNNSGATAANIVGTGQNTVFLLNNLVTGLYTISYNYTNNMGCLVSLTADIQININVTTPTFDINNTVTVCDGDVYPILPTTSNNGVVGQWYPIIDTTQTTTYTFVPNNTLCSSPLTLVVVIPVLPIISGAITLCVGDTHTYTANIAGGIWSVSDPDIAIIDPNSGKLSANQLGSVEILYTILIGGCNVTSIINLNIIDDNTQPTFSFPTNFCEGTTPSVLPSISDNGITGTWIPANINTDQDGTYQFIPLLACIEKINIDTHIINQNDVLESNNDAFYFAYSASANTTTSVVNNDTFNGNAIDLNTAPFNVYISQSSNLNITMNADGTFNLPPDLPIGVYNLVYKINNDCIGDNSGLVSITIYDPVIRAPKRLTVDQCFDPNGYVSSGSIFGLEAITIGGLYKPMEHLVDISDVIPFYGINSITLNANGTFNVPANTPPGQYYVNYTLCPKNSTTGCVYGLIACIQVFSRVSANFGRYYFYRNGVQYIPANDSTVFSTSLIEDDDYWNNCSFSVVGGERFPPAILMPNGNVTLSNAQFVPPNPYFSINNIGEIQPINIGLIPIGRYYCNYTICDALYPTDCSTATNWVDVISSISPRLAESKTDAVFNINQVTIAPNPSEGLFEIDFKNIIKDNVSIQVFNILGQLLISEDVKNTFNYELNLIKYAKGNYLLKITSGNDSVVKKLTLK